MCSWGWNTHGQLGHGDTETVYEPKLIKYFKKKRIIDVSAGYCHSIALDSEGVIYSFGSNVYGQLGCSDVNLKKRNLPEPIYLIDKIDLISSKYFQSLAYAKKSKAIYYFGTSPQNNQLMMQQLKKMRSSQQQQQNNNNNNNNNNSSNNESGLPTVITQNNEHKTPRKLVLLDFEIKKLETGNLHCMLLTNDGKVYTWGKGLSGQLGKLN